LINKVIISDYDSKIYDQVLIAFSSYKERNFDREAATKNIKRLQPVEKFIFHKK